MRISFGGASAEVATLAGNGYAVEKAGGSDMGESARFTTSVCAPVSTKSGEDSAQIASLSRAQVSATR